MTIYENSKLINKINKRKYRERLKDEAYEFLLSEEGERAEYLVSSLCNELGIKLEADLKSDDDEIII